MNINRARLLERVNAAIEFSENDYIALQKNEKQDYDIKIKKWMKEYGTKWTSYATEVLAKIKNGEPVYDDHPQVFRYKHYQTMDWQIPGELLSIRDLLMLTDDETVNLSKLSGLPEILGRYKVKI